MTLLSPARWIVLLSTFALLTASRSRRCSVPAPVTTISSRRSGSAASVKFCSSVAPGASVITFDCARKPIRRAVTRTCWLLARAPGTFNRYDPSAPVQTPMPSSKVVMLTSRNASPVAPVTLPVIVTGSCATSRAGNSASAAAKNAQPKGRGTDQRRLIQRPHSSGGTADDYRDPHQHTTRRSATSAASRLGRWGMVIKGNTGKTQRVLQLTKNSHKAALPRDEKLKRGTRPRAIEVFAGVTTSLSSMRSARFDAQRLGRTSSRDGARFLVILDFGAGVRKSGICVFWSRENPTCCPPGRSRRSGRPPRLPYQGKDRRPGYRL